MPKTWNNIFYLKLYIVYYFVFLYVFTATYILLYYLILFIKTIKISTVLYKKKKIVHDLNAEREAEKDPAFPIPV